MSSYVKDPAEVLDYKFDFNATSPGPWLNDGETITTHTVTVEAGITKDSDTADSTSVTVWLSGGTAGTDYIVTCHVTTSAGRQAERSIRIIVTDR